MSTPNLVTIYSSIPFNSTYRDHIQFYMTFIRDFLVKLELKNDQDRNACSLLASQFDRMLTEKKYNLANGVENYAMPEDFEYGYMTCTEILFRGIDPQTQIRDTDLQKLKTLAFMFGLKEHFFAPGKHDTFQKFLDNIDNPEVNLTLAEIINGIKHDLMAQYYYVVEDRYSHRNTVRSGNQEENLRSVRKLMPKFVHEALRILDELARPKYRRHKLDGTIRYEKIDIKRLHSILKRLKPLCVGNESFIDKMFSAYEDILEYLYCMVNGYYPEHVPQKLWKKLDMNSKPENMSLLANTQNPEPEISGPTFHDGPDHGEIELSSTADPNSTAGPTGTEQVKLVLLSLEEQKAQIERLTLVVSKLEKTDLLVKNIMKFYDELNPSFLKMIQGKEDLLIAALNTEHNSQKAEEQRKFILCDDKLKDYYHTFLNYFNGTLQACQNIHSGWVEDARINKSGAVAIAAQKIAKHIPILGIGLELFSGALQAYSEHDKAIAVNRIVEFFPGFMQQLSEMLARDFTFAQRNELQVMPTSLSKFEKLSNTLLTGDLDNKIKKKAYEDYQTIFSQIMSGTLTQTKEALLDIKFNVQRLINVILPYFKYDLKYELEQQHVLDQRKILEQQQVSTTVASSSSLSDAKTITELDRTKQELLTLTKKHEALQQNFEMQKQSFEMQKESLQNMAKKMQKLLNLTVQGGGDQAQGMLPGFVNTDNEIDYDVSFAKVDHRLKQVEWGVAVLNGSEPNFSPIIHSSPILHSYSSTDSTTNSSAANASNLSNSSSSSNSPNDACCVVM